MWSKYYAVFASPTGTIFDVVDEFLSLSYTRRLNEAGLLKIVMPHNYDGMGSLATDSIIGIRREKYVTGGYPTGYALEFGGVYRGHLNTVTASGRKAISLFVGDGASVLARSIVAYHAGVANRSQWTNVQSNQIFADLILYNNQSGSGRLLPLQPTAYIATGTNPATGVFIDYAGAYKNLLTAAQEVAALSGGYFHVTKVLESVPSFIFDANFGTDRTATVLFALERTNLLSAEVDKRRLIEPTKVLVGGQGEGTARTTVVRTSANYATTNHTEVFVDARDVTTTALLEDRGDTKLAETEYKPRFTFRAAQTDVSRYGIEYYLGDLVTATYEGETFTQRIVGVTVNLDEDGRETIELDLADA